MVLIFALTVAFLFGHEEHQGMEKPKEESVQPTQGEHPTVKEFGGRPQNWAQWVGGFHFIFFHFQFFDYDGRYF